MMRLTVVNPFVNDQEEALRFYVDRLGFVLSEDNRLVGRQGGGAPIFGPRHR